MELQGYWYNGKQSGQQAAFFRVTHADYFDIFDVDNQHVKLCCGKFSDVEISSRLGNTPRFFYFPQGQKFETRDNDLVDQMLKQY